jgi:dihydropteroate synthase
MTRSIHTWSCRNVELELGRRTLVMGILNVTPDSFSDGGQFASMDAAAERALEMEAEGADIIDIGGESTRPGAQPVSPAEEQARTIPVIEKIRAYSGVPISIDTMKAAVAEQALEAGANIINDVSALEADEAMSGVAAAYKAGVVLMHKKGNPQTMQDDPAYDDVVGEVCAYLQSRRAFALGHGIGEQQIVVDPGIGFGKTYEHNLELLKNIPALAATGMPLLIGASRKRFIGQLLEQENPVGRCAGSLGVAAWSVLHGAHILRVHDVIETCDVCRMLDTLDSGDLNAMERSP